MYIHETHNEGADSCGLLQGGRWGEGSRNDAELNRDAATVQLDAEVRSSAA